MYSTIQGIPQILLELLMQSNKKLSHKKAALGNSISTAGSFFSGETESPQCFQIKLDKFWLYGSLDCIFNAFFCDAFNSLFYSRTKKNCVYDF